MDTARPAPPRSLTKTLTNLLRSRRTIAGDGDAAIAADRALKPSKTLGRYPAIILSDELPGDTDNERNERDEREALLSNLFVGISAIKAGYAQLQVAQSPYNPDAIQSADKAIVSHIKHLSHLKHAFLKKQLPEPRLAFAAEIEEQRNLLKTFEITAKKLEAEIEHKDAEIHSLRDRLLDSEQQCRAIDARLHPHRSLSSLYDLHLSGLNAVHFLSALRFAVKSVRSFVKQLVREMESAGWDVDAAAGAIHPDVLRRGPAHGFFAYESYVCLTMFSDFHRRDFGLRGAEDRRSWDRRRFFDEFSSSAHRSWNQLLDRSSTASRFARAKYLAMVHPKMEASFFGDLNQRTIVRSGKGFPETTFFAGFADMARRVWLLHCLFFSFESSSSSSPAVFQAAKGTRFSEVFMESVTTDDDYSGEVEPTVAFTVVPGFRVDHAVIQSRVYLSCNPTTTYGRF
ncbi:protein GRAVITROPIC IN THE LIGHT 1-like isoform X2 [Dioscorea cayenensis subsp. rotundata]|uniref:Protein GRAVITROPIC IN THE LIGHT 1-like isoform X1 n=1 Tax=Dioscorea cayennensis subsp. rotundata TaxID=55577 RepID=A0AB40B8Y7_DIOCR|nr:protein GRAVITROPIC IN THE LIGHT 1-like isoform X1 [Dioscorea cayenensis subsp. rotundata]XP_039123765.1 protein GRAVITROPIC IN THE LIGHT 1-like isoform X2 [Dioscorea cayenensis subsp. rotundata]